jgi:SAM-dependent methyltransferase
MNIPVLRKMSEFLRRLPYIFRRRYCVKRGYMCNLKPIQYQDTAENSLLYQVAAYQYAADHISNFDTVLDVGCGCGLKLEKYILPTGAAITGVDTRDSIEFCAQKYAFGQWFVDDIERPVADFGTPFDFIICADVIEHLYDPDTLFNYFQRWSHSNTRMLISTPERDLRRGSDDMGPPANGAHVREWNSEEFQQYLRSQRLDIEDYRIVELTVGMKTCQLALCSWRNLARFQKPFPNS